MQKRSGFTLIELMIAVAVVAILAAIAYPSYRQQILKSNRTDARVALMQAAQLLEKCYTVHGAYNDAACNIPASSEHGYYTIIQGTGTNAGDTAVNSFTLTATATGNQADDSACGSLSLDNVNVKHAKDKSGTTNSTVDATCWK